MQEPKYNIHIFGAHGVMIVPILDDETRDNTLKNLEEILSYNDIDCPVAARPLPHKRFFYVLSNEEGFLKVSLPAPTITGYVCQNIADESEEQPSNIINMSRQFPN